MSEHYKPPVKYLGNVINNVELPDIENIKLKIQSKKILFIGTDKYIIGANQILNVFKKLQKSIPDLSLHFVGLEKSLFKNVPENVFFYGYLDKDKTEHRTTYYELLRTARIFVNTNPKWGSFSSSLEVMHFYTPVIVSPYAEFVETFGKRFKGGFYSNNELDLEKNIISIIATGDYYKYCIEAHNAVEEFTWENYSEKFLSCVEHI